MYLHLDLKIGHENKSTRHQDEVLNFDWIIINWKKCLDEVANFDRFLLNFYLVFRLGTELSITQIQIKVLSVYNR